MSRLKSPVLIPDAFDDRPAQERRDIEYNARQRSSEGDADPGFASLKVGCRCPQCECLIPGEFVVRQLLHTPAFEPTTAITTGYCEHCKLLFHYDSQLRGGFWSDAGPARFDNTPASKRRHFAVVKSRLDGFLRPARAAC